VRALALALVASGVLGCGPAVPEYTLVPTAGGGAVKLERKEEIRLADGSRALLLHYRSEVESDDEGALRAEVDAVWRTFQPEADRLGIATGLIEAHIVQGERWSRIGQAQRFAYQLEWLEGTDQTAGTARRRAWKLVDHDAPRTTTVKPL
jgi:hypothetical protein